MRVVEKDHRSRNDTGRKAVARLPHDPEDNADCKRSHHCGHRSVCNIGDLVGDVRVADVFEEEGAIVSNKPACEREEELAKGRVDIEEVGALKVVGCELWFF